MERTEEFGSFGRGLRRQMGIYDLRCHRLSSIDLARGGKAGSQMNEASS